MCLIFWEYHPLACRLFISCFVTLGMVFYISFWKNFFASQSLFIFIWLEFISLLLHLNFDLWLNNLSYAQVIFSSIIVALSLSRVWLFCDPMDCSVPGSSVHGIFQARILEWVAISSWPRDQTRVSCVSCIGRWIPYYWATWDAPYMCIQPLIIAFSL